MLAAVILKRASSSSNNSIVPDASSESTSIPQPQTIASLPKLRSVYITCEHPFDEVETFVEESCEHYNLDLVRISGNMKEALAQYLGTSSLSTARSSMHLAEHVSPHTAPGNGVKAIVMGTRRNDPHSSTHRFSYPMVGSSINGLFSF